MNREISPIIKPEELILLKQNEDLAIINAGNGKAARESFDAGHLIGARFADLDSDLADVKTNAADGGRHPLPTLEQFSRTLAKLGLTPESYVVVYDDKQGANAAARFWWMLKAVGHEKVRVLDGGFQAAVDAGFLTTDEAENDLKSGDYKAEKWLLPTAEIDEAAAAAKDENSLVVDVREAKRYNGETEPIDLIAGHIPGAVNIPFSENLDSKGFFLTPEELREKYAREFKDKQTENIIVHCGSGVTACHTLLAAAYAGLKMPKLYVGSWSEWSRNDRPIAGQND